VIFNRRRHASAPYYIRIPSSPRTYNIHARIIQHCTIGSIIYTYKCIICPHDVVDPYRSVFRRPSFRTGSRYANRAHFPRDNKITYIYIYIHGRIIRASSKICSAPFSTFDFTFIIAIHKRSVVNTRELTITYKRKAIIYNVCVCI